MADGRVKKKAKDHGDIGGSICIPGCAGGMGGSAPPEEVAAVADEIVLKLKQGDKDFRHFTQGFTVTRMPPPPPSQCTVILNYVISKYPRTGRIQQV